MFCPRCKYEYKEGLIVCPDCGAEMVDKLDDKKEAEAEAFEKENDLMLLYSTNDHAVIHLIRQVFDEREIAFYIRENAATQHLRMGETGASNSVQIYAEKDKIDVAKEILEDILNSEVVDERFLDWRENESAGDVGAETAELCEVNNEIEAEAIRAMLDSDGIYSFIRSNVLPSSRLPLFFFKPKGFGTIIVNAEDLERARQVLEDYRRSI